MSTAHTLEQTIIDEDGFKIIFSNMGGKPHGNPTPINWARLKKECRYTGCTKLTTTAILLCSSHSGKWKEFKHTKDWIGSICPDSSVMTNASPPLDKKRPLMKAFATAHYESTEYLVMWAEDDPDNRFPLLDKFFKKALKSIIGWVPDATSLQTNFQNQTGLQPTEIVKIVKGLIEEFFPFQQMKNVKINKVRLKIDKKLRIVGTTTEILTDLPIRIVAATQILGFICEEINRGDKWYRKEHNYKPNDPAMGGAFMSVVYYYIRRHTDATPRQARMCVK